MLQNKCIVMQYDFMINMDDYLEGMRSLKMVRIWIALTISPLCPQGVQGRKARHILSIPRPTTAWFTVP